MANDTPPTPEELARVLDDVFRRALDNGERNRDEREAGAPEWIPEPQTDPRSEGIDAVKELPRRPRPCIPRDALRASALGRVVLVDQTMGCEPGGVGAKVYTRPLPIAEKTALVASVCYNRQTDEAANA